MSDYISLSQEQKEICKAVDEGYSCFVNAVPGAGKTTLALHIAKTLPHKKILLLTFSSDLKVDARNKKDIMNLNNLDIHSYNSLPRKFYDKNAKQDEDIYNIIRFELKPILLKDYDLIILDETQDMTHLHYKFINKVIMDLSINPNFLVIGDERQAVFKFKGADSRFLTLSPEIFKGDFKELKLTMSFRLTDPMSQFMNEVILNENRIRTDKPSKKNIQYIIDDPMTHDFRKKIFKMIKKLIVKRGYTYDDFFILSPSVKSPNSSINLLDSYLSNKKINGKYINIYRPPGDEGAINSEHMKGKITMTTYHRAKGRERKCVIVLGCDESYYKIYTDMYDNPQECVEPLYVALTRGTERLIIVHDVNRKKLPFIKLKLSELNKKSYCDIDNPFQHSLDNIGKIYDKKKNTKYSVTQITRYISQDTELKLIPLMDKLFTKISQSNGNIPIKNSVIFNDLVENVSHLNGDAIPALWEKSKTGNISLFNRIKSELKFRKFENNNTHLNRSLKKLKDECIKPEDFLLLSNIAETLDLGIESNLNQIKEYNWLEPHIIERSFNRLNDFITEDEIQFEKKIKKIASVLLK